jgi:hypothetical protein
MKRWAVLLGLFLLAVIVVLFASTQFRADHLERRHATIRLGMTHEEVAKIMDIGEDLTRMPPQNSRISFGHSKDGTSWCWRCRRRPWRRDVELVVLFYDGDHVTHSYAAELQQ